MNDDQLTTALQAAARAFLAALDEPNRKETPQSKAPAPDLASNPDSMVDYDPLYDTPPWTPDPKSDNRLEEDLCTVTYLGGIARINAEQGRGAVTSEIRELALKAGYSGANAVNGWNTNKRGHGSVINVNGERFLNPDGHEFARRCAANANIRIVGDITPLPIPVATAD